MPAYLSLISGVSVEEMQEGGADPVVRARVMRACAGFVLGFSLVFIVMGVGAVAIGYWVFDETPDLLTWIGSAIIVGAGLVAIELERRAGVRRRLAPVGPAARGGDGA